MNQKGNVLLIVLLIAAAVGGYLVFKPTPAYRRPPAATTMSKSQSDETANWKTYTNTEAKVSFQYPNTWTIKEEKPAGDLYKRISAEGKEGQILIDYGGGFGGACPTELEKLEIGNSQNWVCHTIRDDGSEDWAVVAGFIKNNVNYSGFVKVNSPYKNYRRIILQILSTFKFQ